MPSQRRAPALKVNCSRLELQFLLKPERQSCLITDDSIFYSMNLVYFILILILNTGILMAVASNICKMKQVIGSSSAHGPRERPGETCRSSLTFSLLRPDVRTHGIGDLRRARRRAEKC
ncbi:hypothetical protein EYF80_039698 [Liparis tanakae]|uniref:Uncharacterized protein n=1 Tax=Liparis tanakae TaxID=230148 RepID=A0A4Z2GBT7_9TELE|nr:hypothetical protein EYF80_039698 [Liparis tanakae]